MASKRPSIARLKNAPSCPAALAKFIAQICPGTAFVGHRQHSGCPLSSDSAKNRFIKPLRLSRRSYVRGCTPTVDLTRHSNSSPPLEDFRATADAVCQQVDFGLNLIGSNPTPPGSRPTPQLGLKLGRFSIDLGCERARTLIQPLNGQPCLWTHTTNPFV